MGYLTSIKKIRVTVDIHDVPTKSIINNLIKEIETNCSPSTRGEIFEKVESILPSDVNIALGLFLRPTYK
jgi:hypothetical protein